MPANTTQDFESAPLPATGLPTSELAHDNKSIKDEYNADVTVAAALGAIEDSVDPSTVPTEEEIATLRKVAAPLP